MKNKILVIDDSEEIQVLINAALKNKHDLTSCTNARDAISAINKESFDLILLDLMLPDISGFELATVIKESTLNKETLIIVISAKDDVNSKITAYSLGAINYIQKPFQMGLINSVISSTLSLKTHERANQIELDDITVNVLNQTIEVDKKSIKTTSSEFKIFCYLLQRKGLVVSREALFNIVTADHDKTSDRVIDTHISSLRKKLKDSKVVIKAEYKSGYVLNTLD